MSFEWSTTFLRDLITYKKGFAFKSSDYQSEGVPVIRVSNFTDNSISSQDLKFVSPAVASSNSDVMLQHKDIVIATVGSWPNNPASVVGRTISVPSWAAGSCMNQNSVIIRTKSGDLSDQEFIYYQMKTKDFSQHIISKAQGSANQASITLDAIFSYQLSWPNYSERRSITKFLTALDDRITLLRETNATLEAIAQALFKSWFVDFDPVHANAHARAQHQNSHSQAAQPNPAPQTAEAHTQSLGLDAATAALFPDHFQDSDLGPIPAGWECKMLGEICTYISRGISPKYVEDEGVLVINQKCIRDFAVDTDKARRHDSMARKITGREIQVGDVLVNSTGVGTLGRLAQVLDVQETMIVDSHVTVVRANNDVPWTYLGQWMVKHQPIIEDMGEGSTGQTELSRSKLADLMVLVPSSDVLKEFDKKVIGLKNKVSLNNQKAKTLTQLRDTLLPRLISGQLRLPEAEQLIADASL